MKSHQDSFKISLRFYEPQRISRIWRNHRWYVTLWYWNVIKVQIVDIDTEWRWLVYDRLKCQNSTRKRSYWIRDLVISWERQTFASIWASPRKKILPSSQHPLLQVNPHYICRYTITIFSPSYPIIFIDPSFRFFYVQVTILSV